MNFAYGTVVSQFVFELVMAWIADKSTKLLKLNY